MVDRVKLLDWALRNSDLTTKQKSTINSNVEKALDEALSGIPLSATENRASDRDLIIYLSDSASPKTLNALSQRWEPERGRMDPDQKSELKHDLIALLRGERPPYSKLTASLSSVRALDRSKFDAFKHTLSRIAPASDLGALIKQWDPDLPKKPTKRAEQVPHLIELAKGQSYPHPSKKLDLVQIKELARTSPRSPVEQIDEREPVATLKARIKKWDKHLLPQPATKSEMIAHICGLVSGSIEPTSKPPAKRKSRKT